MSDEEKARAFVDGQHWIFAKTMSDSPHFYCQKNSIDPELLTGSCITWLPSASWERSFYGKSYQYFFLGDRKYCGV